MDELRQSIDTAIDAKLERRPWDEDGGRVDDNYERIFNQKVNLWTDYPPINAVSAYPVDSPGHKM